MSNANFFGNVVNITSGPKLREEMISPKELIRLKPEQLNEIKQSGVNPHQYLEAQRSQNTPVHTVQEMGFFERPKAERYAPVQVFLPGRNVTYSDPVNSVNIGSSASQRNSFGSNAFARTPVTPVYAPPVYIPASPYESARSNGLPYNSVSYSTWR